MKTLRLKVVGWLALAALTGCAAPGEGNVGQGPSTSTRRPTVEIIAHRGASAYAPENTLAAFNLAVTHKADWFELDCTLCKSGEVIVIHDDTLERTTNGTGRVDAHDLAALQKLDAGSWKDPKFAGEPLPTLGEALDLAQKQGIGVYVEVKGAPGAEPLQTELLAAAGDATKRTPDLAARFKAILAKAKGTNVVLARKVIALIRERRAERAVVVQSFEPVVCAVAAIEAPELRVELLVEGKADDAQSWERALRWMYLLDLAGLNPGRKLVTQTRVAGLKEAGRSIAVWTVNDPDEIRRLAKMGVDRLITDKPDLVLEILKVMQLR